MWTAICRTGVRRGLTTADAVRADSARTRMLNGQLREIYAAAGMEKRPNAPDRDMLCRWVGEMGMTQELILLAAEYARGAGSPMMLIGRILRDWSRAGIATTGSRAAGAREPYSARRARSAAVLQTALERTGRYAALYARNDTPRRLYSACRRQSGRRGGRADAQPRKRDARGAFGNGKPARKKPKRKRKSGATRRSGRSPAIAELLARRQKLLFSGMRQAFASPEQAARISASMKDQMERMNADIRRELVKSGLSADYLQPVYRCPLCKDTGYVGEPVHEPCVMPQKRRRARIGSIDNDGLQGLEHENFDTFDERIFPDAPHRGQKGHAANAVTSANIRQNSASSTPTQFRPGERKGRAALRRDPGWARRSCSTAWRSACWNADIRSWSFPPISWSETLRALSVRRRRRGTGAGYSDLRPAGH